jgi:predicted ATPase
MREFVEERVAARRAVIRLHLAPVMFELGARPHQAQDLYRAYLEQSHIFIGIYGESYGWVGPGATVSGLEEEYHLAKGKPKLIYIREPSPERAPRLKEMIKYIRDEDRITYKRFSSPKELGKLIEEDLALLLTERFRMSEIRPTTDEREKRQDNLPIPLTPLLGREKELRDARSLLLSEEGRLVTFTGPGGSGKTRLAIEVAGDLVENFDEVSLVELATVENPDFVLGEIARMMGLHYGGSGPLIDHVKDHLYEKKFLLVLDNFEQVADAAPIVADLLESCPRLKVLVTSRMALRVRGERVFPVPPLPLPETDCPDPVECFPEYPAVALFIQRAQAVKPQFNINEDNIHGVAEICRRLDGLPLAIELAAARTQLLSPQAMLQRFDRTLPLLTSGARDLPERQQTMRKAIEWSTEMLEPNEAVFFRRLSVFVGNCTLQAAEAVCNPEGDLGDSLEFLEVLVSKSLLRQKDDASGELRFEMLETIREYAMEKLKESGEEEELRDRHAKFFVELVEEAEPNLPSVRRTPYFGALDMNIENMRAVTARALDRTIDPKLGARLVGAVSWFCNLTGHVVEARNWASSLLDMPELTENNEARAKLLLGEGGLAWSQGDYESANTLLEESVSIFDTLGDKWRKAHAKVILGGGIAGTGDYDRGLQHCEESVSLMEEVGDRWGAAYMLSWLGDIEFIRSRDTVASRAVFEESLGIFNELGDEWGRGAALNHLGVIARSEGKMDEASRYFQQSLNILEKYPNNWAIARGYSEYAEVVFRKGELDQAESLYKKNLVQWKNLGNKLGVMMCLASLAKIAAAKGEFIRAANIYGAVPEPVRVVGLLFVPVSQAEFEQSLSDVRAQLGDEVWNAEYEMGRAMPLDDIVSLALE